MSGLPALEVPVLSDELFGLFRQLIQRETGIWMRDSKKLLVSNRVKKRMRQAGVETFADYYELLHRDTGGERVHFIDAVTTNETYFYRGESHFVALSQVILPDILSRRQRVSLWSVGCSTGEEPYTLAMVALQAAGTRHDGRMEILATDISSSVIGRAQEARYDERALRFLPAALRERYVRRTPQGDYRVCDEVRRLVTFNVHNALRDAPPPGLRDVILCRNVMIYFDTATQKRLVDGTFAPALSPGGYLFIGHSESLIGKSSLFSFSRVNGVPVYRLAEGALSRRWTPPEGKAHPPDGKTHPPDGKVQPPDGKVHPARGSAR
jgi:chemotaxis protein methyltransferase CheR